MLLFLDYSGFLLAASADSSRSNRQRRKEAEKRDAQLEAMAAELTPSLTSITESQDVEATTASMDPLGVTSFVTKVPSANMRKIVQVRLGLTLLTSDHVLLGVQGTTSRG